MVDVIYGGTVLGCNRTAQEKGSHGYGPKDFFV
jgi:hypothetical protein